MRRLRFAMVALVVAISIPVALLIALALQSVAFEESSRHQTLAARAFDEMERSLSRFLEEEEARPIEHYSYFIKSGDSSPSTGSTGSTGSTVLIRSPLSRPSPRPFVVGYFEIDTEGRLHTPFSPRPGEAGTSEPPGRSLLLAIDALERLVPSALPGPHQSDAAKKAGARASGFGTTITLEQPKSPAARLTAKIDEWIPQAARQATRGTSSLETEDLVQSFDAAERSPATPRADSGTPSLDEALESLNVGQKLREQRVRKRSREGDYAERSARRARSPRSPELASGTLTPHERDPLSKSRVRSEAKDLREGASAHAEPPLMTRRDRASAMAPRRKPEATSDSAMERFRIAAAGKAATGEMEEANEVANRAFEDADDSNTELGRDFDLPADAPEIRIEIDPMMGHLADQGHLVLSRTVLVGSSGYRQGLLIDRRKLAEWLNDQVISGSRLGEVATLRFEDSQTRYRYAGSSAGYLYRHHFAEPFAALQATLSLKPLAAVASTRNIYALSLVLAVVAAGGLFAVYRMIVVVVRYAERRSNFVAAVSHELKTPLTAIRMHGEMLRDGLVSSDEKRNEYYRTIHDESERLSRLINNVLEFSQLESGKRELNLVVGSLAEVVREFVANLGPHAERQGFTLGAQIADDLPPVRFDRDALVQVLFNLTDNAMKYARGAGPQAIEIGCHRADEHGERSSRGDRVMLEVRDFGPGVPSRHLSHLFEPFYRAASSDEVAKGTGIGMALVSDLCQAMGAAVTASNVEGGGFRVLVGFRTADT